MKKFLVLAAFLLATTAAQAQMTFQYGGYTIRVDPDRGTVQIPGIYDNTGQKSKRAKTDQDSRKPQDPQQAKANPQPAEPPAAAPGSNQVPAPAAASVPSPAAPAAPTATSNNPPAEAAVTPPPLPPAPPPAVTAAPAAPLAAAAVPPAAPPPAPAPAQQAAAPAPAALPARDPNSPLGVWLTEEKEGKVRIEQCGTNLCGYSVDSKSNQNGEQVLINMKPGKDKWTGRILDPNTGSTYDSTIALNGPDRLRVQGCAFGGMFCGGQTWTRVN